MSPSVIKMEESKPAISNCANGDEVEIRFADLCKPDELERYMFAFVLYTSKRLGERTTRDNIEGVNQSGITLCQILKAVNLNLVDFFKELPQFIVKVGPILSNLYGSDFEKRLEAMELRANFVHLSLLSKYYKRAYQEYFKTNEADKELGGSGVSDYYRFGWLLFLALRVHAFSRFKDLVTCTNGLVSVLTYNMTSK